MVLMSPRPPTILATAAHLGPGKCDLDRGC